MWFFLSLGSALFASGSDLFAKYTVKHADPYVRAWAFRFFALLLLLPLAIIFRPATIGPRFWSAIIVIGIGNTINSVLYMKALAYAPLSLVAPITALVPMFTLFITPFVNKESPGLVGIAGVCLMVVGTYLLQVNRRLEGFWVPFTSLVKDRGPRFMLLLTISWGITSAYDKVAVQNSNPFFYLGVAYSIYALALLPMVLIRRARMVQVRDNVKTLAPLGLFQATSVVFQMSALPFTYAAYVVAIKNVSAVLGVLWGKVIFKEEHIQERLLGAVVILAGITLIVLS